MLLNGYKIEKVKSKDNYDVLVINNIYIHSKYSPVKEAASVKYKEKSLVLIFGFGLGYHVKNIIENNPDCLFVIYEPLTEIFKTYNQYIDNLNDRILIINDIDYSLLIDFFEKNKTYSDYKIQMYSNTGYKTIFPDLEIQFYNTAKSVFKIVIQNILTESNFIPLWTKNFIYNSINYVKNPVLNINQKKLDSNVAIICSAGPSLEFDIDIIKKYRDKITIFTVDTALKTLLSYNINPDFIVSLDGQLYSIDDFIKNIPDDCTVILDSVCYPDILNIINNEKSFFTVSNSIYNKSIMEYFYKQFDIDVFKIDSGGTVSDYCLSIAVNFGFKNIYFTGLDLSFPDLQTHSRGTPFYDRTLYNSTYFNTQQLILADALTNRELIKVQSRSGKYVYSDFVMQNYSYYLKQYSNKYSEINIYINKFDGIKIDGLKEVILEDLINDNITNRLNNEKLINNNDCLVFKHEDLKIFYEKLADGLFSRSCDLKNLFEITDFEQNNNYNIEKWDALYKSIIKDFPFLLKFGIKTDMVLIFKEINDENLLWYKHSGYKLLQSMYYLIRIIQKALKKLDYFK